MDIDTCMKTGNHPIEDTLLQTHLYKYIKILVRNLKFERKLKNKLALNASGKNMCKVLMLLD